MWHRFPGAAPADDHRSFDDVLQFADVAGPVVVHQQFHRPPIDTGDLFVHAAGEAGDEMMDQGRDVLAAFAKGRDVDGKDIQPKIQVLAKVPVCHVFLQVAIGGGNYPDVDRNRLITPHAFDGPLLQHAQHHHLRFHRNFGDLVQEDAAALGQLEAALPLLRRAGKRPGFVAEQLAGD